MPLGSGDYEDEGDESDMRHAISTASWPWWPATEHERFDQGTSDVDGYEGMDCNEEDADDEEGASQADGGSTQNVED